jgi:hypothetical protein
MKVARKMNYLKIYYPWKTAQQPRFSHCLLCNVSWNGI